MATRKEPVGIEPMMHEVDDVTVRDLTLQRDTNPRASAERNVARAISGKASEVRAIISKLTDSA